MNIVFCSSEVFPFAKTGGLADVAGALPLALERLGIKVNIFLPGYKTVDRSLFKLKKVDDFVSKIELGKNIDVYLIEHHKYFHRDGLYGDLHGDFGDNLDRFSYFCDQVLLSLKRLNIKVDVIHCHDWHTALISVFLKERYFSDPFFQKVKTIMTIHNMAFQGVFSKDQFKKLHLRDELLSQQGFEFYGQLNLLKAAIIYSDKVTTVSPQYAREIQTTEFGCGLENVLKSRKDQVIGILNGIDYDVWNPKLDPLITANYSFHDFEAGKLANKKFLQEHIGFTIDQDTPLFGYVGRLAYQKGIDLLVEVLPQLANMDVQIVLQGLGEEKYFRQLKILAERYPKQIEFHEKFDESFAHAIYAGSDFLLMPSVFEPCGLSQMIALRYGTVPIVYKTGGLMDTVKSLSGSSQKNGFIFDQYNKDELLIVIKKAIEVFKVKKSFYQIIENAFNLNCSWEKSAQEYKQLYLSLKR